MLRIAWRGNGRGKTTSMSVSKKPGRVQFKSRLKEVQICMFQQISPQRHSMFINGNNYIGFSFQRVRLLRALSYIENIFSREETLE